MEERRSIPPADADSPVRLPSQKAAIGNWLWPTWAVVCGVIASGRFTWRSADWLRLLLLVLLVNAGWGALWTALHSTDWATPLRQWRLWRTGDPFPRLPYTLPHSPGDRIAHWLGQMSHWWRSAFQPACGQALSAIAIALLATGTLAALLGPSTMLLSLAFLAILEIGLAMGSASGRSSPMEHALIAVALPWAAGHTAFNTLTLASAGAALAFALSQGAAQETERRWKHVLNAGGQTAAAAILIAMHRPLAAGSLALLLFPQLALLPWLQTGQQGWYARHTQRWLAAAMLIAAWAF